MNYSEQALLASNSLFDSDALQTRVLANLQARVAASASYGFEEIAKVSRLSRSVFPKGFRVGDETVDSMRVLCAYSCCELRPGRAIRSHRKFIGPLIVFLKRASWPIIKFHLRETFESIQLFHSWAVYELAKQAVELEKTKARLRELE